LRKISEHKVVLPEEYQGFLLINGLQLTENEARAMLNFTHGCIRPTSVKEWLRKNETKLSAAELGADRKKANGVLLTEALDELEDPQQYEVDEEINELEAYLMDYQKSQENDPEEILEENEAAEILATVLQQKRSYKQALKLRKEKELSRGYGKGYNGSFSGGKGRGKPSGSNRYNVSIEEVRKRTRCWNCNQTGHRAAECAQPSKRDNAEGNKVNAAHHLEKFEDTNASLWSAA
jgi:hypothetical protein